MDGSRAQQHSRVDVGKQCVMPDYATLEGERGCLLNDVLPGSPADKSGLRSGDRVVLWNGKYVKSVSMLSELINEATGGQTVRVTVARDGEKIELEVTLGQRDG